MKKDERTPLDPQDTEKDPGLRNVVQWLLLIAVLTAAWFLLDWLINSK